MKVCGCSWAFKYVTVAIGTFLLRFAQAGQRHWRYSSVSVYSSSLGLRCVVQRQSLCMFLRCSTSLYRCACTHSLFPAACRARHKSRPSADRGKSSAPSPWSRYDYPLDNAAVEEPITNWQFGFYIVELVWAITIEQLLAGAVFYHSDFGHNDSSDAKQGRVF